jgi:[ribosomal protein S5]-alanine N-acetyltransferase
MSLPNTALEMTHTTRVCIAPLQTQHAASLLSLMQNNQAHFAPWNPLGPSDFYTLAYWQKRAEIAQTEAVDGTALRWVIEAEPANEIIGTINVSQIARGPFHSAMLGYQIAKTHEGQGLMFEALTLAISHAFEVLKLHRLQASYVTANERSARVLQRLGFETIGTARHYLFIDGAWRDHVMTQLINTAFDESTFTH